MAGSSLLRNATRRASAVTQHYWRRKNRLVSLGVNESSFTPAPSERPRRWATRARARHCSLRLAPGRRPDKRKEPRKRGSTFVRPRPASPLLSAARLLFRPRRTSQWHTCTPRTRSEQQKAAPRSPTARTPQHPRWKHALFLCFYLSYFSAPQAFLLRHRRAGK